MHVFVLSLQISSLSENVTEAFFCNKLKSFKGLFKSLVNTFKRAFKDLLVGSCKAVGRIDGELLNRGE